MKPRQPASIWRDQRGVVLLEFLVAFVPIWILFLCVVQLAFIAHADLMVKHSADAAARSAAVVLPDDPNEYGGEPELSVSRNRASSSSLDHALLRVGPALWDGATSQAIATAVSGDPSVNLGRSRLNTIRLAAHVPLIPLAPTSLGRDPRPSIEESIGDARKLVSAAYYQSIGLAVTFPGLNRDVADGPEVTVRVDYAYQCMVPFARNILCASFDALESADKFGNAVFPAGQRAVGGRFRAIHHETTLLIHDAPYAYRGRTS